MNALALTFLIVAVALGAVAAWLFTQRARMQRELFAERERARAAASDRDLAVARLADMEKAQSQMRDAFKSLASDELRNTSNEFLKIARQTFATEQEKAKGELEQRKQAVDSLVKPLHEKLEKTGETLNKIEQARIEAYARLAQQTQDVLKSSSELRVETSKLVQALRKPQVRGRYGEIQLERVVELAGMREYCDFDTQSSMTNSDGVRLRPDMVVRLPNERLIAIDAKTNIEAYLDAIEADNAEDAERHLDRFARHVADQAQALSKKEYGAQFETSPEFVVMFIPGDQFIDAALQRRPDLLDLAADQRVIIASPSTLIGLLRAVHVGWREKSLSESAQELFTLGRELHERAVVALESAASVGKAIDAAKERYNRFVGSVDRRLMPTLRKFEEQGAKSTRKLEDLAEIEGDTRTIQSLPAPSEDAQEVVTRIQDGPAREV